MKTAHLIVFVICLGGLLSAQEKPVPKDSTRVFINGCAKGLVFIAGERTEDQPGRSDIPEGARFRLSGPKKVLNEIKAHRGTAIEVTSLVRKGQFHQGGIALGGHVRVGGATPMSNDPTRTANVNSVVLDVEGWRPLIGYCPN